VEKAVEWFDWLAEPYAMGVSCSGKEPPRKRSGALFVHRLVGSVDPVIALCRRALIPRIGDPPR